MENVTLTMTPSFQTHLRDTAMLFRFLCMVWGYSSNHGDQLEVKLGAVLQTRALHMGTSVLRIQSTASLKELAAADSPGEKNKERTSVLLINTLMTRVSVSVVPSLLCCLGSPVREVREVALGALQSLSGAGTSPFQPIIEKLLKTPEEIVADASYLSTVGTFSLLVDRTRSRRAFVLTVHETSPGSLRPARHKSVW